MMRAPSEDEGANDVGIPAVVANDKAGTSDRGVEGAQILANAIEVPGGMCALCQLNFVVAATDSAFLVEKEGAVEGFIADSFSEPEREASL